MAKNSFLLNDKWKDMFVDIPDELAGQLIKAVFLYHAGEDFSIDDPVLSAVFGVIRRELDENERKYENRCKANAENGQKGGRPKAHSENEKPKKSDGLISKAKKPDNDNDNDLKEKDVLTNIQKESPTKVEPCMIAAKEIIDYLNQKIGTHYRPYSKDTVKAIKARLAEKFTVDDFKKVIDVKAAEWLGTDMEKHLNPETLFRPSHFEKYLNQKPVIKSPPGKNGAGKFANFPQRNDTEHRDLVRQIVAMQ